MPLEYQDPNLRPDQVNVTTYSAGKGHQDVLEKRTFNRFQDEEAPTRAKRRSGERRPMGDPVERKRGSKCWTEQKFEVNEYLTPYFIKTRWVEYWRVNVALTTYYEFVDDVAKNATAMIDAAGTPVRFVARAGGYPSLTPGTPSVAGALAAEIAMGSAVAAPLAETLAASTVGSGVLDAALLGARGLAATGSAASAVASVAVPAAVISGVAVGAFITTTEIVKGYQKAAEKVSEGWEFVGAFDGPEYLEKTSIVVEKIFHACPKPKPPAVAWVYRWWLWILLLLVAVAAAIWIAIGSLGSSAPSTTAATTVAPATTVPSATGTTTPTPTTTSTAVARPDGIYRTTMSIKQDPGHSEVIRMPQDIELTVMTGSVIVLGPSPWVGVLGEIDDTGHFIATGTGTVAGFSNVSVLFEGTLDDSGISGDYTMGAGGELPGGEAMVYSLDGHRLEVSGPETVEAFATQLQTARQTGNLAFMLSRLHPFVISLYGLDTCYEYLPGLFDPLWEFETLDVSGPGDWVWDHDGQVETLSDIYTVSVLVAGAEGPEDFHFGLTQDGLLHWFADCGEPAG